MDTRKPSLRQRLNDFDVRALSQRARILLFVGSFAFVLFVAFVVPRLDGSGSSAKKPAGAQSTSTPTPSQTVPVLPQPAGDAGDGKYAIDMLPAIQKQVLDTARGYLKTLLTPGGSPTVRQNALSVYATTSNAELQAYTSPDSLPARAATDLTLVTGAEYSATVTAQLGSLKVWLDVVLTPTAKTGWLVSQFLPASDAPTASFPQQYSPGSGPSGN